MLRVEAGLIFGNTDAVRDDIKRAAATPDVRGVVLDAEAIAVVDVTAVRMLHELGDDLARTGQRLVIARDIGQIGDVLDVEPDGAIIVTRSIPDGITAISGTPP